MVKTSWSLGALVIVMPKSEGHGRRLANRGMSQTRGLLGLLRGRVLPLHVPTAYGLTPQIQRPPCQSRTKHQWGLNPSASSCSALIMCHSETQQHLRNSQRIKHPKTPTASEAKLPAEEHSRSQGVRACIF